MHFLPQHLLRLLFQVKVVPHIFMTKNKPNEILKGRRSVEKDMQAHRTSFPGNLKFVRADLWHALIICVETLAHRNTWIGLSVTEQKITRPLLSEKGADKKAIFISPSQRLCKTWDVSLLSLIQI